jgi:hypothetical protein
MNSHLSLKEIMLTFPTLGWIVLMETGQNTGDSCYTCLCYLQFYFSIMRSILSAALVEAAAQAHWVAHAVSLSCPIIFNLGTIKWGLSWSITQKIQGHVIHFLFYAFSIYAAIRRNATPAYNESHLQILVVNVYKLSVRMIEITNAWHNRAALDRMGIKREIMIFFWSCKYA